jgi:carbon storage regulator
MLILTRHRDQSIFIGDDIQVRVLSISGNQARIGIVAPKNITVHREEIYIKLKGEQNIKIEDEIEND